MENTFNFKGLDLKDDEIESNKHKIPVFGARNEEEIGESSEFWAKLKA